MSVEGMTMNDASKYLPPAEIEAIRKMLAIRATMSADEFVDYVSALRGSAKALLAHIDAIEAPADGEALGRELWAAVPVVTPVRWEDIEPWLRDRYRSHALKCHAIGHAAGVATGEDDRAELHKKRLDEVSFIAREMRIASETHAAEIARLTAELADRDATIARAADAAIEDAEKARRFGYHERDAEVATARADGAREERRFCMADLRGEIDGADDRAFAVRVADRIERRALGNGSSAVTREPAPTRNDGPAIWPLLIDETRAGHYGGDTPEKRHLLEDMAERDRFGRERYGTPLQAHNGRDALIDAYQEALDLPVYLRQAQEEGAIPEENGLVDAAVTIALRIRRRLGARTRGGR